MKVDVLNIVLLVLLCGVGWCAGWAMGMIIDTVVGMIVEHKTEDEDAD